MAHRILFVSDRYPPYYTGGYEVACQTIVDALRRRGWKTLVVTSTFGVPRPRRDGHVMRILHRPEDATTLLGLGGGEIADTVALRTIVRLWRPDAVYVWCVRQLHASVHGCLRDSGVPIVFNIADAWLPGHFADARQRRELWTVNGSRGPRALLKRAGIAVAKTCVPTFTRELTVGDVGAPYIISCSKFREDQHLRLRLPARDPVVIYNGVDMSRFHGSPDRFADLRLLFAGRLVPEKGVHTIVPALASLAARGIPARLTIAGVKVFPWRYSDELKALVARHGLEDRVSFLDAVPPAEMVDVYRRHNVLLFPSTIAEGLPMSVLEAMACGLLVVGTTVGGTAELLEDAVTGIAVPPEDPVALGEALADIVRNPARALSLATEGQARVRAAADLNVIADRTEAYVDRMIAASND